MSAHLTRPNSSSIDIGSGSGLLSCYMAYMSDPFGGKVVGVDHIPELVDWSI